MPNEIMPICGYYLLTLSTSPSLRPSCEKSSSWSLVNGLNDASSNIPIVLLSGERIGAMIKCLGVPFPSPERMVM
jgi:hypothetical protein